MLPGGIMAELEPKDASPTSHPELIIRDILAIKRTAIAAEGSFKGWMRTGLSLIGFGFTIYEFLLSLPAQELSKRDPVEVGLFMIGMGTVAILFGATEYWETMRELHQDYGLQIKKAPLLFGLLIAGFGIALFLRIAIHRT